MSRMLILTLSQSMRSLAFVAAALLISAYPTSVVAQAAIPVNGERYMIVLKPPKAGVPALTDADVAGVGGHTEYKVTGRIEVTMSASAVEALRAQGRVKYIQKMILGPLPNASAAPALRLTPSAMSLRRTAEATPPTWTTGTYRYDTSGNIYAIGLAGDAGAPVQHRYAYDKLSRLTGADTITTTTYSETFTYDPYGNMIQHINGGATTSTPADIATNRLQWSAAHPYTYDAAGNLTADYNAAYAYDPFSMLREKDYTGMQPEYYIYTASDERIGVKYASYPDSATVWSIRDFSGNVLRQYEGHDTYPGMSWLWVEDYVYGEGRLLAAERVAEEGGRRYFHLDHLGSPRLVTGQDGREMSEHDFASFGLESNPLWQETAGGFDREDPKRFTGHERDYAREGPPQSTFYIDYMHARYYGSNMGRFLSVDPEIGDPVDPQSWNRYPYARNSPLVFVDPDGRDVIIDGNSDDERKMAFEALKSSLHDTFAASRLMMVKVGAQYEAKIAGNIDEFKAGTDPAFILGMAIGSTAQISFGLGVVDAQFHGASTQQITGTNNSVIRIDPSAFPEFLDDQDENGNHSRIYETMDLAIQHELGHAFGIASLGLDELKILNLSGRGTNEQALHSENMARAAYVRQIEAQYGKDSAAARAARLVYKKRLSHSGE